MKAIFFLIGLAILAPSVFAQKLQPVNVEQYIAKLPRLNLKQPVFSAALPSSDNHFSKFTIIDYRPDSSRAGVCVNAVQESQITFGNVAVKNVVDSFLNKNYSTTSSVNEVVVVLKKLWYTSVTPKEVYTSTGIDESRMFDEPRTRLQFAAESYVKTTAGFVPLAAFDTTILDNHQVKSCGGSILSDALAAFAEKLSRKNIDHILVTRKPFDERAVDSISKRNFQYRIYTNEALKTGVYLTANDFFNNTPSAAQYEIQKTKDGASSLYLKNENGQLYLARNIWGYCNGETSFVILDGNLFPVSRNGNALFVLGSKLYQLKKSNPNNASSPYGAIGTALVNDASPNTRRKTQLFTVDNTTGEVL